jgi:membrane-associated protein
MFDLATIIKTGGYLAVGGIVFAESGLLVGFFLPGDSLLFTAGFLASQGFLDIHVLAIISFIAAVVGDSVGYGLGATMGRKIFAREDSFFFNKKHVARAEQFFAHHGGKAITLARFVPVVRTFIPTIAGVGRMHYKTFVRYNIAGAFLWAVALPYMGYFLGTKIPGADKYIQYIVLGILFLSISPGIVHVLRHKEDRAALIATCKHFFKRKI